MFKCFFVAYITNVPDGPIKNVVQLGPFGHPQDAIEVQNEMIARGIKTSKVWEAND